MEEQKFKVIIVEDVKLELKGTEDVFRHEIPNAEVIGTAMTENEFWPLMEAQLPDLVLLDLGLGSTTTIGVDICRNIFKRYKGVRVLIFTGEILKKDFRGEKINTAALFNAAAKTVGLFGFITLLSFPLLFLGLRFVLPAFFAPEVVYQTADT